MKALRSHFTKSHRDTSATREQSPARSVDSQRRGWWERKKHNVIDAEFTGVKQEPGKSAHDSPGVDNETSNSVLNVDNLALAANIVEKIANVVDKVPFVAPVAALLSEVLKTCKEIQDMGENRNTLNTKLGKITKDLDETKTRLDVEQITGSLRKDVEEYAGLLAKALALISGFDGQNKAFRAVNQKEWASRLTALERELDSFASRFIIKRGIETQIGLSDVQFLALAQKLREWLKFPPDMAEKQHATQKLHHKGTGNWFLNGGQFHEWKKNPGSLWIEGQSGAGKSVLSSTVIAQLFDDQPTAGTSAVAYFYFDFRNEQNQLVEIMLRSIILQLSAQSPTKYTTLDQQYNLSKGQTLPTYGNLLDILEKLLLEFGHTYIILDALDECNEQDLLVRLISLLRGWSSKTPVHLLFTSQTRELFTASFEGVEHVSLELETTQEDIATFVTSELESNSKLKRWAKHTAEITRKVVEKSNGMFRLAACLLIELSRRRLERNPDSILANLPGQLFEIYHRFLESIHPNDFVLVEVALRWLVWSARPLSLAELEDALAFDFSDPHRHVFHPTQRDQCATRVCSLLEGLIAVDRLNYWTATPVVILAHASVADYLKSPQFAARHKCDLSQGLSHTFLAHTCVGYLLHFADHPLNAETFPDYPLSSYAAEHWSYHLLRCDDRATLERSIMRLLEAGSDQYAALNHLHRYTIDWLNHLHCPEWHDYFESLQSPSWGRDGPPPLHLCSGIGYTEGVHLLLKIDAHEDDIVVALRTASGLGHTNIVRLLLEKVADVNAADAEDGSALHAASGGGHTETVCLLLEKGADISAECGRYGNALQAAAYNGSPELVRLLLKEGADVNAAGGYYGSALQAASYQGSPEVVQLLLENGADVNAEGGHYGSALQAASYQGSPEVVQLLLENGADVNAEGGHYGSALQAASITGNPEIVELLVESGADVNATGGEYGSALQAACVKGKAEIVRILLEKGAEVNAAGGLYGTVLRAASLRGHIEIARLLLEKGADVNASGGYYGSALQAASVQGSLEIIRLLLEKGADISAECGTYGNALQAAAYNGSPEIVRILLKEGADVNAAGGFYGNALQAASAQGSLEIVLILLKKGADVNVAGGYYGSALQAASGQGSLEIVQLLLENGAGVNATGGEYGSALQAACSGGHTEIVRLLFEKGADVNATGGYYGSALQAASCNGSPEVVRLLLESGANVNATGGPFGSALQAACMIGEPEIVRILLERGAEVNAVGGHYGTALQAASIWGQTEIVRLLLENGADVNASGGEDGSPLQDASWYGDTETVQLLREHGAVDEILRRRRRDEEDEEEDEEDEEDEDEEEVAEEDL
ncbi:ankyrin repeat-containing domain protein [Mycena epipterygia]|nr:ankyrin repeat-containing domain protein [Mycena epipterygia]